MDILKGGLADNMTVKDIAKKHGVSVKDISKQLSKGIKVELEHVDDDNIAKEIALDHLFEDPKYYDKLEKIHVESNQKSKIKKLLREATSLLLTDETPETYTYDIYYNDVKVGYIVVGKPESETLDDKTYQIYNLVLLKEYANLKIAIESIRLLWKALPKIYKLVVSVTPKYYDFWEKLGFTRLNDYYLISFRGHS